MELRKNSDVELLEGAKSNKKSHLHHRANPPALEKMAPYMLWQLEEPSTKTFSFEDGCSRLPIVVEFRSVSKL